MIMLRYGCFEGCQVLLLSPRMRRSVAATSARSAPCALVVVPGTFIPRLSAASLSMSPAGGLDDIICVSVGQVRVDAGSFGRPRSAG